MTSHRAKWLTASLLFLSLFLIYNSNGREIGGIDSQPAKFAARALVLPAYCAWLPSVTVVVCSAPSRV